MRRSSKRRGHHRYAVSLFPFLAVLVCTLGVLIVLLVIAVQSADTAKREQVESLAQQQRDALKSAQDRGELLAFEAESVLLGREGASQRLAAAKSKRSYLEQRIRDTQTETERLLDKLAALDKLEKKQSIAASEISDQQIASLVEQHQQAAADLVLLRKTIGDQPDQSYTIVPHTGVGGTRRRPIFVECVADGLILQPYGIKISKQDFVGGVGVGNMLDSALLAVREYWAKHQLAANDSSDSTPYPLLVIRPDGAQSYGLARRAMKSWDNEFGYELVTAEKSLDFGAVDLQLKSEIHEAVDMAKRRQLAIARQKRRFGSRPGGAQTVADPSVSHGLLVSPEHGGFIDRRTGLPASEIASTFEASSSQRSGIAKTDYQSSSEDSNSFFDQSQDQRRRQDAATHPTDQSESLDATPASSDSPATNANSIANSQSPHSLANAAAGPSDEGGQAGAASGTSVATSLANQRGVNWALPSQSTGARAYIRPVRLVCQQQKITLRYQHRTVAVVNFNGPTRNAVDALISELWKTVDSWGIAGRQAYWKPELRFTVLPGGEARFRDLKRLLDRSGLIVEHAE